MLDNVNELFSGLGLTETQEAFVVPAALLAGVLLIALLAYFLAKTIIVKAVARFAERTTTQWDNILVKRKVFVRLAYFAPVLVFWFSSAVITSNPTATAMIRRVCEAFMIVLALMTVTSLLGAIEEIYSHYKIATRVPIKGYIQVVRILLAIAGTIFMLSVTMDKSPWIFLSGMGALGAILLLVFKDPIMGLVAGVGSIGEVRITVPVNLDMAADKPAGGVRVAVCPIRADVLLERIGAVTEGIRRRNTADRIVTVVPGNSGLSPVAPRRSR